MTANDVAYFSEAIARTNKKIEPFRQKLTHDIKSLTIEELYVLRELLHQEAAISWLFSKLATEQEETPKKRKFFGKK